MGGFGPIVPVEYLASGSQRRECFPPRTAPAAVAGIVPQRLWGNTVLQPLGYCLEPSLPERGVRECLNVTDEELLVFTERGPDVLRLADCVR